MQRIHRSAFVKSIIAQILVLDFNQAVTRVYAKWDAFLKPRKKSNSNVHDVLVATPAITPGFTVLTRRVDNFKKVQD